MELRDDEKLEKVNHDISLIRKKNGLTFGTDAYLLAAYIPARTRAFAIELGGGTGIISLLLLAAKKCASVTAVEVQPEYCDLMKRNAALGGFEQFSAHCADVRALPDGVLTSECADVVFSNPPYMKADSGKRNEHDEKFIARHEVCGGIDDFCGAAERLLKYGGSFYCVYRTDRLIDLLASLRAHRLEPKKMTFVHADKSSEPSIVLVEAKKGASPSLVLTKPLILHPENAGEKSRPLSPDAERIYETCSFADFFKK